LLKSIKFLKKGELKLKKKLDVNVNRGFSKLRFWSVIFKLLLFPILILTMIAGYVDDQNLLTLFGILLTIDIIGLIVIKSLRFIYRD
jgi:hypothetical protein